MLNPVVKDPSMQTGYSRSLMTVIVALSCIKAISELFSHFIRQVPGVTSAHIGVCVAKVDKDFD